MHWVALKNFPLFTEHETTQNATKIGRNIDWLCRQFSSFQVSSRFCHVLRVSFSVIRGAFFYATQCINGLDHKCLYALSDRLHSLRRHNCSTVWLILLRTRRRNAGACTGARAHYKFSLTLCPCGRSKWLPPWTFGWPVGRWVIITGDAEIKKKNEFWSNW